METEAASVSEVDLAANGRRFSNIIIAKAIINERPDVIVTLFSGSAEEKNELYQQNGLAAMRCPPDPPFRKILQSSNGTTATAIVVK